MKKSAIALIIVVAIAIGAFALAGNSDNDKTTNSSADTNSDSNASSDNQTQSASPPASTDQGTETTITYSDSGFSPDKITVKSETTVTIKNTSSNDLEFASDPHPIHTSNEELNEGAVTPGQSKTFTVNKKGTFGYHNHLNASDKGTIVVE